MESDVAAIYGGKVRVRACGVCIIDDRLLMVNHRLMNKGDFWAPPGGGVEFGQSLTATVEREFREETGLDVLCGSFLFGCEFIDPPLHAIELFFEVKSLSGTVRTGHDPELQIIRDAKLLSQEELEALPPESLHGIFRTCRKITDLINLKGFYTI